MNDNEEMFLKEAFDFFKKYENGIPDKDEPLEKTQSYFLRLEEINPHFSDEEVEILLNFTTWDMYSIYTVVFDLLIPYFEEKPEILFSRSSLRNSPLTEYKGEMLAIGLWFDFGFDITPETLDKVSKYGEQIPLPFWEEILLYIYSNTERLDLETLKIIGDTLREVNPFTARLLHHDDDAKIIYVLLLLRVPFVEEPYVREVFLELEEAPTEEKMIFLLEGYARGGVSRWELPILEYVSQGMSEEAQDRVKQLAVF